MIILACAKSVLFCTIYLYIIVDIRNVALLQICVRIGFPFAIFVCVIKLFKWIERDDSLQLGWGKCLLSNHSVWI